MDTAADKLEACVRKAETNLDLMACKLETELSESTAKETGLQLNPCETLESFDQMKNRLQQIKDSFEKLRQNQKETQEAVQTEIQVICKKLQVLEDKAGAPL